MKHSDKKCLITSHGIVIRFAFLIISLIISSVQNSYQYKVMRWGCNFGLISSFNDSLVILSNFYNLYFIPSAFKLCDKPSILIAKKIHLPVKNLVLLSWFLLFYFPAAHLPLKGFKCLCNWYKRNLKKIYLLWLS